MRRVTVGALGDVTRLLRVVRHVAMRAGLLSAGRRVLGGLFDELVERPVATQTLVLGCAQNPRAGQNADADEGKPNCHA